MTDIATTITAPPRQNRRRRQQPQRSPSSKRSIATSSLWMVNALLLATLATSVEGYRDEEYYRERRAASKPWLMKEFPLVEFSDAVYTQIVGLVESQGFDSSLVPRTVFVSPFTIILLTLVLANVHAWASYHLSGTWVEASHILIKDTGPKTLKALNGLRDQLGKDAKLFGLTAKQYSQCPSAEQLGDLGRFGPGVMAPPFDRVCFDPATPLNETLGPVQTQFGYHLIYLRKRKF